MENQMQKVEDQPIQQMQISPIMQLADKLAEGTITADQMQTMLDVQIKWEENEAKKAYHAAMARFQENAPSIIKSKQGHNCQYADLAMDIVAVVAPKLSEHGLSHKWITESVDGGMKVTCKITHKQGYSEENSMFAAPDKSGSKNDIQALGSTVTYLQRYTLKAALGLAEGGQGDNGNGYADKKPQIPEPTALEWECIDKIIAKLPQEEGFRIDRKKVSLFFLRNGNRYPDNRDTPEKAAEYVVKRNPRDIYVKESE